MTFFTDLKFRNLLCTLVMVITLTFLLANCQGLRQKLSSVFPVTGTENQKLIIDDAFWAQFYNDTNTQVANNILIESEPLDSLDPTNGLGTEQYSDTQGDLYISDSQLDGSQCLEDTSGINCPSTDQSNFGNQENLPIQTQQPNTLQDDNILDNSGNEIALDTTDTEETPLIIAESSDPNFDETPEGETQQLTNEAASQIKVVPKNKIKPVEINPDPAKEPDIEPIETTDAEPVDQIDQSPVESTEPIQSQIESSPDKPTNVDIATTQSPDTTKFYRWPVTGRIVKGFGVENDGINIAVPEGTPVKVAENGEVVYSGNELEDFGNLVIVRHNNGWISAYAHNKELIVEKDDKVKRGDEIAHAGATGAVDHPQLHFMLRNSQNQPVNPLDYLPKQ